MNIKCSKILIEVQKESLLFTTKLPRFVVVIKKMKENAVTIKRKRL